MLHKTLAADTTVTDTDLGTFEAIVSAWEADREKDVIARHAFDKTIAAWIGSGKQLPLLFEHGTIVVGAIDPASMHPTDAGLVVAGEVDRAADEGKQAWRSIKAGTAGFSIGFMAESVPRKGGGRELVEIDLLEVSITSKPMHPATRALSWKSTARDPMTQRMIEADHAAIVAAFKDNEHLIGTKAAERAKSTAPIRIARFEA